MKFHDKLRRLRQEKKWSVKYLANLAGLSPIALYHFENGTRLPEVANMNKLAKAHQLTLEQLVSGCPLYTPPKTPPQPLRPALTEYRNLFYYVYPEDNPPKRLLEKAKENRFLLQKYLRPEYYRSFDYPRMMKTSQPAVIKLRTGFETGVPMTLHAISRQIGSSRLRVIQKNRHAYAGLRRILKALGCKTPLAVYGFLPTLDLKTAPNFLDGEEGETPFKDRLPALLQWRGWTWKQLAQLIPIKIDSLRAYKRGERLPDLGVLQRLAEVFEIPLVVLLTREYTEA